MASTSAVGPRGLSGEIGEAVVFFQREYQSIRQEAQRGDLSGWCLAEQELLQDRAVLQGRIQEYAQKYLRYEESVVQRARKLFEEMKRVESFCRAYPDLTAGNWEYLKASGVNVELLRQNILTVIRNCISPLGLIYHASDRLYQDTRDSLNTLGASLDPTFGKVYEQLDPPPGGGFWGFWEGLKKRALDFVPIGKSPSLDRALKTLRFKDLSKEDSQSPLSSSELKRVERLPPVSQEEEIENLKKVAQQLQAIVKQFHLDTARVQ